MSRCFPFPPPGYEKKPRSDNVDLLAKEKNKEKKHKKEKRDKENREGKEKKDKDRSKDKHREKKDRKEKHKDKKKDKDKDKSRLSENRGTEEQTEGHHADRFGECNPKAEEGENFKFTGELARRIKDEEKGAASRMVENFTSSIQRTNEKSNTVTVVEKKRVAGNEMVSNPVGTMQRRNDGMGHPQNNFPSPLQRRIEGIGSRTAMQKERSASNEVVANSISSGQRGNTGMVRPAENSANSIQRRYEGPCIATASEKERGTSNKIFSKSSVTVQRPHDGMGRSADSLSGLSGSIQRKIDGVGLATAMEKEGRKGNEIIPNHIIAEQRRNDGIGKSVAKDADKKIEGKEKIKERGVYDEKGEKHKDQNRDEKNKGKDQDRHHEKEKKKEKIREKGEHKHKEQQKRRDSGKKSQIDSLNMKPLAPQKDNDKRSGTDVNTKKRKDFEMNGFLHEIDVRPNKFSRAVPSSHLPMENGRTVGLSPVATSCSSINPGVINNAMAERVLEIKDQKINDIVEAKTPSADWSLVPIGTSEKAKAFLKPPHPDAKYLSQIYSVPKMEEWPESDDQEWLFSSNHVRPKHKMKFEVDETPQVWAQALRIESADAIALPYVIPF
ncbi:DEAD-box ATP-dependent RNA helicase 42 [Phoenix dactylifera]|uniref:DEAD-box ATP-dependent RNA helicase 42 n=1 Tax=Phoenix dactylifera TaxID=42345 RepID=A0A8B7C9K9_PHODC|nr:DEAD-box ATP-dependent RNA helicase 42 [Phoenix dactylifera]